MSNKMLSCCGENVPRFYAITSYATLQWHS